MRRMVSLMILAAVVAASLPLSAAAGSLCTTVDGNDSVVFHSLLFQDGEPVTIWAEVDGPDVDCAIHDENGHLIDVDADYTDTCLLEFEPIWTGPFSLEISNMEMVYSDVCVEIL